MCRQEKKKILFISSNMSIGGFQKSLISVLQCFDYERYEVDLLLLNPTGIFIDLIPAQVRVLEPIMPKEYFDTAPKAISALLRLGKPALAMRRLLSAAVFLIDKGYGAKILSRGMPPLKQHYDAAIDYNGQQILYYLADGVNAANKISYFHSDYKKWSYYEKMDRIYYKKVDAIVTVSDLCVQSMQEVFPEHRNKISCIENIISDKTVSLFPKGTNGFRDGFDGIRLVTVGRACKDKGLYLAAESCALLKAQGFHVRWYWVGPCDELEKIDMTLGKLGIREDFLLLGSTNNPYDYMREADLIVHPSYYEGKSVAIEEAKVLGKPIVATDFSTVRNQIEDEETGLIVAMEPEKIADRIGRLLTDKALYEKIEQNLRAFRTGNESEIEKLYRLIEGN